MCYIDALYIYFFLQGPGPSGKNEEKGQVLTEKIEDLVLQVCKEYVEISALYYMHIDVNDFDGTGKYSNVNICCGTSPDLSKVDLPAWITDPLQKRV